MPAEPQLDHRMRRELAARAQEQQIADLAVRQHGVVGRRQLCALGFSARAVDRRVERGRLNVVHRGVYAVGHRILTVRGYWMAAVLAGGPRAVLSHRSAAEFWELLSHGGHAVDVTVARHRMSRPGLRVHETWLRFDEVEINDRIPVTTVGRTLLDLAAAAPSYRMRRAFAEAERRGLGDSTPLVDLLSRYPGRRGVETLRRLVGDSRIGLDVTRSELEDRFFAFIENRGLPRPEVNAAISLAGGRTIEADFLWRAAKLIVELDSHAFHRSRSAFESDRARDRAAAAAGWRTIRVTPRQLLLESDALASDLWSILDRRAAT